MTTDTEPVVAHLRVMAAYHAVQRQLEYGNSHPLAARKHHAAYVWLRKARQSEETDPMPKGPCDCQLCSAVYAKGRA